ncbi:barwin-like endoglucanase [Chlorella sorokiniana]|uniref:Barwin-like endoglucanase n=1 Tax=Chlorella sorokiniana TaxID=3076 RepID=A0A2P6TM28_CHLSO|nr:barwin-like endoglucanase [Chlorella sorokiniana]|eukprot:PRW45398.1 barwin-like endoglucanase [Chlorella sorokiniana]
MPPRPSPRSSQRLMGSRALAAALLAAWLAFVTPAAAVKAISSWQDGLITHFGGAQDGMDPSSQSFGTKDGACGFGVIPKDKYPYFSTAALSPSNQFFTSDELHGCGQCFQIQCADDRSGVCKTDSAGVCKTDSAGKPLSIAVMISDKCPECEADHIDVQSLAFAKMADPGIGRIKVQYRRIQCLPPDDMKVSVMDFRSAGGWLRLVITTTGGRAAVKSVAVKGSNSDWQTLTNSWGATWEMPSAPQPPLSFKIVGDDGEEVVADDVIKQSGGISNGANGPRTTFSAGVQFSISDPAFGKVTAFDGQSDPMLITSDTPGADDSGNGSSGNGTASSGGSGSSNSTSSGSSGQQQGECKDVPAPGSYSCQQQKDWGKCYEGWFEQYCRQTCGRCGPNASAPQPGCSDVPTPDGYSCQQQKDWGKCEQSFIKDNGYCKATCGACSGGQPEVQAYNGPSDSSPSPSPSPGGRRLSAGGRRLLR